jgi:hypothetical protein
MPLADILAGLGDIGGGYLSAQNKLQTLQGQQYANALRALVAQQAVQQQQASPGAFQTLQSPQFQNLFGQGAMSPQPQDSSAITQPQAPMDLPQVPNATAQMSAPDNLVSPQLAGSGVNWTGENPVFQQRVSSMLQAMPPELRSQSYVDSGYRTDAQQADIYARSKGGTQFAAAAPGHSLHERGLAADWEFKSPAADQWVHQNAQRYGLDFPFVSSGAGAGGRLSDPNHMQLAGGASALLAKNELSQSIPQPLHQQGAVGASNTFRQLGGSPLMYVNRFDDPSKLAQVISQANPNATDDAKMAIFEKLYPLLSNSGKTQFAQAWDIYKEGVRESEFATSKELQLGEFRQREADRAAQMDLTRTLGEQRLAQGAEAGGQVYQPRDAQGQPSGPPMWIAKGQASPIRGMPEGAAGITKVGPAGASGGNVSEIDWLARYVMATGTMPVGFSRSRATLDAVYAKVAELGGDPSKVAEAAGTFKANQSSLAAATKLADAATSYEATALKNLEVATKELHGAAPTNLGPWLNKWIETGETQTGNPNVPASVTAVLTFANEYAKVMSGSTGAQGATVDARREAAELFNPYFSAGQWDAVAAIARRDMANRKQSLYDQVDIIKGRLKAGGASSSAPRESGIGTTSGGGVPPGGTTKAPDFSTMSTEEITKWLQDNP